MSLSLGLVFLIVFILFPGLIFRRLYFYGEFSKEFKGSHNLIVLLSLSSIPGIFYLISIFFLYDNYIEDIDIGRVIDKFKEINNPNFKFAESADVPLRQLLASKIVPFTALLYITSTLLGLISGRLVRILNLDRWFKLLRFKNYWFYLFHAQPVFSEKQKKKHLFTIADVLIETNSSNKLYSGVVVDYELDDNNCKALSKIVLDKARRYTTIKEKKFAKIIPGNLLVIDCSSLKNINLTYVYEETKTILESPTPNFVNIAIGTLTLLAIPFFIFKIDFINFEWYEQYFNYSWYKKIITFLLFNQILYFFNPFVKIEDKFQWIGFKSWLSRFVVIIFLGLLFWIF